MSSNSGTTQALRDLVTAIAAGSAGAGVIDGPTYGTTGTSTIPFGNVLNDAKVGSVDSGPRAYLNYIVFDENFSPIIGSSGFIPVPASAKEDGSLGTLEGRDHQLLQSPEIVINVKGYVYIYLSNEEAGNEVYFDDFSVEHFSPIVQEEEYYPFGLTFNAFQRENSLSNEYKFSGREEQDELAVGWLDLEARMYMADIGRMTTIDPLAFRFYPLSAFSYAANNPVLLNDYTGEDWTISMSKDKDGKQIYNVTFSGAVLNSSSNRTIDVKGLASMILKQGTELFNQQGSDFSVNFKATIRAIDDRSELAGDEHLIELKDGSDEDFKQESEDDDVTLGVATSGKHISLNADYIDLISYNLYPGVVSHEMGHTGGLRHPAKEVEKYLGWMRLPGPTANAPNSNFMQTGSDNAMHYPTGITKEQIERMYRLYKAGELNKWYSQPIHSK